jgi:addiction module HigA family antidote
VLSALGVSISAAAEGMQISRQTLHAVLSGRASVTPEMALRIGRYTDTEPELWLRMQQARDLRLTAEGMEGKLTAIVPPRRTTTTMTKINPAHVKPTTSASFTVRAAAARGGGPQQANASKGGRSAGGKSAGARVGKPSKTAR